MFHVKHSDTDVQEICADVVVIGGGHAGVEAAAAAGRMGASTVLATHRSDRIGEMSCNPAMGGLGKGHLMREVDALDGLIARASDEAGIQFRLLNRSRGPAVRGPRAQIDRETYLSTMQRLIGEARNLRVLEGEVAALLVDQGCAAGVVFADGRKVRAGAVVLTAGTFLRGVMHIGGEQEQGGRFGDPASIALADQLRALDLTIGRLKTGTPARLVGSSIDKSVLPEQPGDEHPEPFSFLTDQIKQEQVCCLVTETNERVHRIIEENLSKSAMRSGNIQGVGPRYCPSIEDKIERFRDKESHNVFLEPETRDGGLYYPNGISTSLPREVQLAFLRSMKGLEKVEVARFGYAIEYDFIDPREVSTSLELKAMPRLFLAGQILGTTGYEEAAALGLVAGLNAARTCSGADGVIFNRGLSYIGVMIDDLCTRGVSEPYRMFTSRAEHRLTLRADNADERLTPMAVDLGLAGSERVIAFERDIAALNEAKAELRTISISRKEAATLGIHVNQDGKNRTLAELLGYPGVTIQHLGGLAPRTAELFDRLRTKIMAEAVYSGFIDRQQSEVAIMARAQQYRLDTDLDYSAISSLSAEQREKLSRIRPANLDQASRVEGVTPAALIALAPFAKFGAAE